MDPQQTILYLAHRLPYPPNKGDRIRTYHQLDYLAKRHRVWCACFSDDADDAKHIAYLKEACDEVAIIPWSRGKAAGRALRAWSTGTCATLAAYRDRRMFDLMESWSRRVQFDAVAAFSACMAPYALAARASRRLLDLCDVDSQKWTEYAESRRGPAAWFWRAEAKRLRAYEEQSLGLFDAITVITNRERSLLDHHELSYRLHVVGNGVTMPAAPARPASSLGPRLGFVGAMDYPPNVEAVQWFVANAWPRIRKAIPLAQFVIIGRNPTRSVRRLAKTPGVELTGTVNDVAAFIQDCRVIVAPLRVARGLQNKILEAMSLARPVIATTASAYALHAEAGRDIVVADRADDFAAKSIQLLRENALCDLFANAGRACIERHHSWEQILRDYERLLLGSPAPRCHLISGAVGTARPGRRMPLAPLVSGFACGESTRKVGRFVS
ncbi:MAG: TIGR03087 family PEP-CTERM/XrtA system glycosyltransferase [Planctomycetes bacterium]|nr:TIGR03087 family PEP-CTERM/XrtA system glycosyltransferase [Planctomycetota bacterium]